MCFENRILVAVALLAGSCTVLEDRDPCPCLLALDFREVDVGALEDEGFEELVWEVRPEEGPVMSGSESLDALPDLLEFSVPKGDSCECRIRALPSVYGEEECPPVFFEKRRIPVCGPAITDTVRLHRHTADMTILFKSVPGDLSDIRLKAPWSGFDEELEPVHFEYIVCIGIGTGRIARVRVPRQYDADMVLEMYPSVGDCRTFAIGNYIEASGYDWGKPDLEDICLEIDCTASKVVLYSDIWQKSVSFSVNL